jgi:hypothetical protein
MKAAAGLESNNPDLIMFKADGNIFNFPMIISGEITKYHKMSNYKNNSIKRAAEKRAKSNYKGKNYDPNFYLKKKFGKNFDPDFYKKKKYGKNYDPNYNARFKKEKLITIKHYSPKVLYIEPLLTGKKMKDLRKH